MQGRAELEGEPPRGNGAKVANRPQPGKRPRSSMSPSLILNSDGSLFAAVGSPGGSRIPTATAQVLLNLIVDGGFTKRVQL